ncbi:MAG TPA: ribonuclease Y [Verrucomicrobiae bacterium]|nr:ribonuclease Y [Verrucomicrobiae bacterium]
MPGLLAALVIVVLIAVGAVVYAVRASRQSRVQQGHGVEQLESARLQIESERRAAEIEAKDAALKLRSALEEELRERRAEAARQEQRVQQREEQLDRRLDEVTTRHLAITEREQQLAAVQAELETARAQEQVERERIAGLTREEARQEILAGLDRELLVEKAERIRRADLELRSEVDAQSREILITTIQRHAADQAGETSVSVVPLPNDEVKGRIIGREGRNIRALEAATGVDLIIDDTPEAVILSGFDPIRREVARVTLNRLLADGRIHPARIEEMVAKARTEVGARITEEGEQALFELGLQGVHPELVKLVGTLRFRFSYGQNVLAHSKEVGFLAGMIAAELGVDERLAKEAGMLHDIGKAVDHEVEGSHAVIGGEILRRLGRPEAVIHAVQSHHYDIEPTGIIAFTVLSADAISAARPGARRETLSSYIKRLEKLEEIANGFEGVERSFALQAGREIRIMVKPDRIDDARATVLARDIVRRIESEMSYPGTIKVTVVRETRAVDYAK